MVEQTNAAGGLTRVLVETSPALREELLEADVSKIDAVF
jgi:hypothetical protein